MSRDRPCRSMVPCALALGLMASSPVCAQSIPLEAGFEKAALREAIPAQALFEWEGPLDSPRVAPALRQWIKHSDEDDPLVIVLKGSTPADREQLILRLRGIEAIRTRPVLDVSDGQPGRPASVAGGIYDPKLMMIVGGAEGLLVIDDVYGRLGLRGELPPLPAADSRCWRQLPLGSEATMLGDSVRSGCWSWILADGGLEPGIGRDQARALFGVLHSSIVPSGVGGCTAWRVSGRFVVTARHCIEGSEAQISGIPKTPLPEVSVAGRFLQVTLLSEPLEPFGVARWWAPDPATDPPIADLLVLELDREPSEGAPRVCAESAGRASAPGLMVAGAFPFYSPDDAGVVEPLVPPVSRVAWASGVPCDASEAAPGCFVHLCQTVPGFSGSPAVLPRDDDRVGVLGMHLGVLGTVARDLRCELPLDATQQHRINGLAGGARIADALRRLNLGHLLEECDEVQG